MVPEGDAIHSIVGKKEKPGRPPRAGKGTCRAHTARVPSWETTRPRNLLQNLHHDAAIARPTVAGVVLRHRLLFAEAVDGDPVQGNTVRLIKIVAYRLRALQTELLVVRGIAARVGMSLDLDPETAVVGLDLFRELVHESLSVGGDLRGIEREADLVVRESDL